MQHSVFVGSSYRPSSSPQPNIETNEDSGDYDIGIDHIE